MDKRLKKYFPNSLCFEGEGEVMLAIEGIWPELVRVIDENHEERQLLIDKGSVPSRYAILSLRTERLAMLEEVQATNLEALEPLMALKAELERVNESVGKKLGRQFRVEMLSRDPYNDDELPF